MVCIVFSDGKLVCWFHGNISRDQAEQALHKACEENKQAKGLYLIRFSEKFPVSNVFSICELVER